MLKKHKSRDQDELFVKISASQQLLEHIAAQEDNFKVEIREMIHLFSLVSLFSVFCFPCVPILPILCIPILPILLFCPAVGQRERGRVLQSEIGFSSRDEGTPFISDSVFKVEIREIIYLFSLFSLFSVSLFSVFCIPILSLRALHLCFSRGVPIRD